MTFSKNSKNISLEEISQLPGKTFVLVSGAIGAGKSYVCENFLADFVLHDPDQINEEQNSEWDPKKSAMAQAELNRRCASSLASGESFIRMGTAVNYRAAKNRLNEAKDFDFRTVLLYISVSADQAELQNIERRVKNLRAVEKGQEYRIFRSHEKSKSTSEKLIENNIPDFFCIFRNER